MHFTDDVVAPLTAERGHNLRAELIPELMMGRSESSGTSEFRLVRDLPPNFRIASRSRREGGELEEKTGGIDDGWREIPVRRAWSDETTATILMASILFLACAPSSMAFAQVLNEFSSPSPFCGGL